MIYTVINTDAYVIPTEWRKFRKSRRSYSTVCDTIIMYVETFKTDIIVMCLMSHWPTISSIRVSKLILIISLCEISIRVSKLILIISLCEIKGQLSKLTMKLFIFPLSFFPAHDFCDPNPCDNNGVCTNYKDSYKCSCPSGYIGLDCEIYQPDVSIQYKYAMFNRNNKSTLEFQGKQCYKDVANCQYLECPAMPIQ